VSNRAAEIPPTYTNARSISSTLCANAGDQIVESAIQQAKAARPSTYARSYRLIRTFARVTRMIAETERSGTLAQPHEVGK